MFSTYLILLSDDAGVEVLFVSEEAVFNGAKAIRGGIPIVFPQVNTPSTHTKYRVIKG